MRQMKIRLSNPPSGASAYLTKQAAEAIRPFGAISYAGETQVEDFKGWKFVCGRELPNQSAWNVGTYFEDEARISMNGLTLGQHFGTTETEMLVFDDGPEKFIVILFPTVRPPARRRKKDRAQRTAKAAPTAPVAVVAAAPTDRQDVLIQLGALTFAFKVPPEELTQLAFSWASKGYGVG